MWSNDLDTPLSNDFAFFILLLIKIYHQVVKKNTLNYRKIILFLLTEVPL